MSLSRSHQTAVFITPGVKSDRVTRLLQSLNGSNMKADIYTVSETTVTALAITDSHGAVVAGADVPDASDDFDFEGLASDAGYNTLIVVSRV